MVANIDNVHGSRPAHRALPDGEPVAKAEGAYQGEPVRIELDLSSQLQDLVEEIGMALAYRGGRRSLGRRKLRHGSDLENADNARLAKYRRLLPDLPGAEALQRLLDNVRSLDPVDVDGKAGRNDASGLHDEIIAALQAYDSDVTNQYAALDMALQHLEKQDASSHLLEALREVQAQFSTGELHRDVRAGFAAAIPASKAAPVLGVEPAIIRSTYRTMLGNARNMADLFGLLRRFDLVGRFSDVVATFTKAAAHDLASTGPSTDRGYLRALLAELNRLSKAKSVLSLAADLVQLTNRQLRDGEKPQGDEVDVAGNMLTFACIATPSAEDAHILVGPYQQTSLSAQLVFANGLREMHGELPVDIAPTPRAHLLQNAAILQMLETLVEAEENEFRAS